MITALQHFISKKGKFVFVLLLLLVIVSFVLYLSQGSSVFDLMSDGGREKKEFFGYDWNNPDQRRFLNITTRAAGALGVLISPTQQTVEKADNAYIQGLQQQIQAAFRANPEEVDQEAMQRLFQYMQAWPNFSRDFKVREIARSGAYDADFLDQSIKTRVVLSGQADAWDFLPSNINHPAINSEFIKFLTSIDPSLESEDNRSNALSMVGGRFGMTGNELESVLYTAFRNMLVDRVYTHRGFALAGEVDILSQQNAFAWDGEVAVVSADDLAELKIIWGEIKISDTPKAGDQLVFSYDGRKIKFEFGNPPDDKNGSVIVIPTGKNTKQSAQRLKNAINDTDFGVQAFIDKGSDIRLELQKDKLPQAAPEFTASTKVVQFQDHLSPKLTEFYEQNNDLKAFMEAPRTFATAMVFPSKNYLVSPPPADDARLRSYFERNRLDFMPDLKDGEGNEQNETSLPEVKFEDVVDDVREKVATQDLADANREAGRLAQDAALDFLDELNLFSDRLRKSYHDFMSMRNSSELKNFLKESGGQQRKISFSSRDMNVQAMVLGLERRASEQRSNREPLEEVEALSESKFFTRSVRKARSGYLVFLLDRKTEESKAEFESIPFSSICQEYIREIKNTQFVQKVDEIKDKLLSDPNAKDSFLSKYRFEVKNQSIARASFDSRQRSLRSKLDKLENTQSAGEDEKKPSNAQADEEINILRDQLAQLENERTAVNKVLDGAESLEVGQKWVELERNEESAIFGLLGKVYSIRGKKLEEDQKNSMDSNLELSRGMLSRDEAINELLSVNLSE
jgi:hypothetical protein